VLYRAGLACRQLGEVEAARAHWQQALAETHHPVFSLERVYVEMCRMELGQRVEAAALLAATVVEAERQQREKPAEVAGFLVGGMAALGLGQRERAVEALAIARRLAPGNLQIARLHAQAAG
jgi:tetratricopeptide (TPR) repeat protein